jgi:hypothetical protein
MLLVETLAEIGYGVCAVEATEAGAVRAAVCTENLSSGVAVMKSAQDGA